MATITTTNVAIIRVLIEWNTRLHDIEAVADAGQPEYLLHLGRHVAHNESAARLLMGSHNLTNTR